MSQVNPAERLSGDNIANNNFAIAFMRNFMSIVAGCACGILGLTGLSGILFFLFSSLLVSAAVFIKIEMNVKKYFSSWGSLVVDGVVGAFMSFVLFWTLLYDVVYIYN